MATVSLRQGQRYEATIALGVFFSFASNDMIEEKFRSIGFDEVEVRGAGDKRTAAGRWLAADATLPVPPLVRQISELAS